MGTATNNSSDYYYISFGEIIIKQELQTNRQYKSISQFLHNETRLQEQREWEKGEGGGEEEEYKPNQRSRKRILVVDDEPDTCLAYQILLREVGHECISYSDPIKALQEFKPYFYDLILLDIKMPALNGFELCKEIREIDNAAQIIFITALHEYDKSRKQYYPELGSIVSLQKPIENEELLKVVNMVMATKDAN
jgi:CheY-like chemotaxis protein